MVLVDLQEGLWFSLVLNIIKYNRVSLIKLGYIVPCSLWVQSELFFGQALQSDHPVSLQIYCSLWTAQSSCSSWAQANIVHTFEPQHLEQYYRKQETFLTQTNYVILLLISLILVSMITVSTLFSQSIAMKWLNVSLVGPWAAITPQDAI